MLLLPPPFHLVLLIAHLLSIVPTPAFSAPTPNPNPDPQQQQQQHPFLSPFLSPTSSPTPYSPLEDTSIHSLLSLLSIPPSSSSDKPLLTSLQLTQAYLTRINSFKDLNAIIHVNPNAEKEAREADRIRRELGEGGLPPNLPLLGIPFLVKDNIAIPPSSGPTTAGSYALLNSTVKSPSTVVQRLLNAGGILLGTTNMDEFAQAKGDHPWAWSALGGQMHSIYGPPSSSPHSDLALSQGYGDVCGSSGGSALSVALGLAAFALGTQTGVSIVCPSNRAGVVGFKPGRNGMTPMSGVVPISKHLDVVGPIGRSVEDVELVWKVIKHPKGWREPEDVSLSSSDDSDDDDTDNTTNPPNRPNRPIRIGVPKKGIWDDLEDDTPEIIPALKALMNLLERDREGRFDLREGKEIHNLTRMTSEETRGAVSIITTHELKIGINNYLTNWTLPLPSSSPSSPSPSNETAVQSLSDIILYNLAHPSLELPPGPFSAFGHPPQPNESYADQSFLLKAEGIEIVGWANESYREAKMVVERNGWDEGLRGYFWGEEGEEEDGVDVLMLPTEGISGTLASLSAVPDITLPLSYYPNYAIEPNATWPLYPYPHMPFGVSLLASRGHDSHEMLLHVAKMVEEILQVGVGERRSMMRDSVRERLEGLERAERERWGE